MRKFLITAALTLALVATTSQAKADNSEEVIIGVMGGVIGGLVLGEILERPRYAEPVRVYEYDEPDLVRSCRTKYVRYYDSMGNLVRRPVKKCVWVEHY